MVSGTPPAERPALFPRSAADLTSTTQCPACFTALTSTTCSACGLDLAQPAAFELAAASARAAAELERRQALIVELRSGSTGASAPPATEALVAPAPSSAPPPAEPNPEAARHIGVQVILLIVGVSLLAVGAIFFLVYAFITFGIFWRSVIVGSVTVAAAVGAVLLRRRALVVTAEALAALTAAFVFLDVYAIRANDLFGAAAADGSTYWGVSLAVSAVGFGLWHRATGLRTPNLVAAAAFGPGVALLVDGTLRSTPFDSGARSFAAFAALGAAGLLHPLLSTARAAHLERWIALGLSAVGLLGAAAAAQSVPSSWVAGPTIGVVIVAVLAATHVLLIARAGGPRGAGFVLAAIGGIAAAATGAVAAVRADSLSCGMLTAGVTAVAVALALEQLGRRVPVSYLRTATRVATWSATGVAAGTLVVPVAIPAKAIGFAIETGLRPWTVTGGDAIRAFPEVPAAVLTLGIAVLLAAAVWASAHGSVALKAGLFWGAAVVAVLAVVLLGQLWLVVLGWLAVGGAAIGMLILAHRRAWRATLRAPAVFAAVAATAVAYVSSWASIDTWWFGSIGAVVLLVVARSATASALARAVLLAIGVALAFVAIGAEGWHANERFLGGAGSFVDAMHFVSALGIVLIGLSAVSTRALSTLETRVLFWLPLVVLGGSVIASRRFVGTSASLVLPEPSTSVILGVGTIGVLAAWVLTRHTLNVERIAASVAVLPVLAWLADSIARAVGGPDWLAPMVTILLACGIHVLGALLARPPFGLQLTWSAIPFAAIAGIAASSGRVVEPLEWATAPIGVALLASGAITLHRRPSAGSWPWLAPGVAVLLLPSLAATYAEQPVWRLVALGVVGIAAIIVGAFARLQAPLVIGAGVVLAHAIRTFAPQIIAVYQLTEWWVWAVIGGALLLYLGFTVERRIRNLKSVASRLADLR